MNDFPTDRDAMDQRETAQLLTRLAETFQERPAPLTSLLAAAREGRRRKNQRMSGLAAAAVALVAAGGTVTAQALIGDGGEHAPDVVAEPHQVTECDGKSVTKSPEQVPQGPDYPKNAAGLTYGGASRDGHSPDLLAVVGDCGRTGYVHATELDEPAPWSPGAGDSNPRTVKVYESDGTTQIDTFTTVAGESGTPGESPDQGASRPPGPNGADVEGDWSAVIAGIVNENGAEQYDTFRDLDLTVTFMDDRVRVGDGCQMWEGGFELDGGAFSLTTSLDAVTVKATGCDRAAPLPAVVENVRLITRSGKRTYLHLANGRIVVSLTRLAT
jgi:hypothetical protein